MATQWSRWVTLTSVQTCVTALRGAGQTAIRAGSARGRLVAAPTRSAMMTIPRWRHTRAISTGTTAMVTASGGGGGAVASLRLLLGSSPRHAIVRKAAPGDLLNNSFW